MAKKRFFTFLKNFYIVSQNATKKPSGKIKSEYFHHRLKKIGKNNEYDSKVSVR